MPLLGSQTLVVSFLVMPLALVALLSWALRHVMRRGDLPQQSFGRSLGALGAWLVVWGGIGLSGVLNVWDGFPPRSLPMLVVLFVVTFWFALSRTGRALAEGLSFRWLIGFQLFRFPLELMLHRALVEGLMPVQMSFEGLNYDIVTGVTAGIIALASVWVAIPRWLCWAFNLMGSALLLTIVAVSIASLPTFALFGADRVNTWVFGFPYVYLPTVMVQWALLGHVLVFRKLHHLRQVASPGKASETRSEAIPTGPRSCAGLSRSTPRAL